MTPTATDPLAGLPLLEDLPDVDGRRVLVRADFNVPLRWPDGPSGAAVVADDFRICAAMPTLDWLTGHGAEVTVCSHLGRPHGQADPLCDMAPVRQRLASLAPGVGLLDNLRFDPGEKANDPAFVDRLVDGFDCYVNDAFGVSHRRHASIVGPPARLPSAAGRLLAREVSAVGGLLADPARPFLAVVGGAKVSDKLGVLRSLLDTVDQVIVGGGMAFTFLAARGHTVGRSLFDPSAVASCRALLDEAGDRVVLPSDVVVRRTTAGGEDEILVVGPDVPDDATGLDIGPTSAGIFADAVAEAGTVFWNGPMGVFEDPRFAAGTYAVAEAIAASGAFSVVGGGDSVAALDQLGLAGKVGFVSTGGGASLELLEHGDLPGLDALRHAPNASGTAGTGTETRGGRS
ncbi:MAG TPA: phosphoglycerate kinase [Acidimicrobiales bacterium]|nr:phosphoglycerate kinase [Acidimicrobiales bacterium]